MSMLAFQKVTSAYGSINALTDISLHINEKEVVTLIGANGAGKSTLMMTLFGEPRAKSGKIIFNNKDITHLAAHDIAKLGIAIAPEGRRIFANMTVQENLETGKIALENNAKTDMNLIFEMFPRLLERKNQSAGTLSGGEQQMLAIGRALMSRPKLLLLDEPSLGLAPIVVKQIFSILREVADRGTTIFLVEQNAHHALKLADRGYVMVNGVIQMSDNSENLANNPEIRQAYLGGH